MRCQIMEVSLTSWINRTVHAQPVWLHHIYGYKQHAGFVDESVSNVPDLSIIV